MPFSAAPEIINRTPFAVEPAFLSDEESRGLLVPIVKATFSIEGVSALVLAEQQQPIDLAGSHWGEPDVSSYRYEPELAFYKAATDIALIGHAYPAELGATSTIAGLRVGAISKAVRVSGDRYWVKNLLGGITMTAPEPFDKIPLNYENAFGGWDRSADDPSRHAFEVRNPVGKGFRERWNPIETYVPLANIEDTREAITNFSDRPAPVGFGFLGPHWQPRASFAGTYDAKWMASRMPLVPQDFDRRFFNAASSGLIAPGYLRGDELVTVIGSSPRGRIEFTLPSITPPRVNVALRNQDEVIRDTCLDTLIIDTDQHQVVLIWRACIAVNEIPRDVLRLVVACDNYSTSSV